MTANPESGCLATGWRLLWRKQAVLWWISAVNFVLSLLSAHLLAAGMGHVLNHSLAAQRLYHGFDLAYYASLAANPDAQLSSSAISSFTFSFLFLLFMLFANGGTLDAYLNDRVAAPGEFFRACGAFFWRFVRLLLW